MISHIQNNFRIWYGNAKQIDRRLQSFNTLRPRRNEPHFADDIFKRIFFNENFWISIKISLKFVSNGPNNNIPALVQIMAWRRSGDKPLSEPMMVSLPTHICVTRPQWVKRPPLCLKYLVNVHSLPITATDSKGNVRQKTSLWLSCYVQIHSTFLFASYLGISICEEPSLHAQWEAMPWMHLNVKLHLNNWFFACSLRKSESTHREITPLTILHLIQASK